MEHFILVCKYCKLSQYMAILCKYDQKIRTLPYLSLHGFRIFSEARSNLGEGSLGRLGS